MFHLCINNIFHAAKTKQRFSCSVSYCTHITRLDFPEGFDLPTLYLIQSFNTLFCPMKGGQKSTYTHKYLPKLLNMERTYPFNSHNVREEGMTVAAEEMLPA